MVGIKHHTQTAQSDDPAYDVSADEWNEAHDKGDIADIANAFTLATLNSLVSDATLDDSGDSRTPSAHDLAGALHNADTLADLNLKISDATLVDMPNTIANVLSDHNKAAHDALGIDAATLETSTKAQVQDHTPKNHDLASAQHPDVNISSPSDGQMMIYDAATSKWKNLDPNVTVVDFNIPSQTTKPQIAPSGDMARKAYYDRNADVINNYYAGADNTGGSWVARWSYTVPANHKAMHSFIYFYVAHPGVGAVAAAKIDISLDGGSTYRDVAGLYNYSGEPAYPKTLSVTATFMMKAGIIVRGSAAASGAVFVINTNTLTEFDE